MSPGDDRDPLHEVDLARAVPIRRLGVIEYLSEHPSPSAGPDARRRLIAAACPDAPPEAASLLDEIAHVHGLLDHPAVPKVSGRGAIDGRPCLAFDCPAIADLETLRAVQIELGHRLDAAGALGFGLLCLEVLEHAHARQDPRTGRPVCLGAVADANVLLDEHGRFYLLGWGHPLGTEARGRLLDGIPVAFTAFEAAFGAPVTPAADLNALVRYFHAYLDLCEIPAPLVRVLQGHPRDEDAELVPLVMDLLSSAHAARPEDRSFSTYRERLALLSARLGVTAALGSAEALGARLVAALGRRRPPVSMLAVGEGGAWFRLGANPVVTLDRRERLRRLLGALCRQRLQAPGEPLSLEALLEAGWPGERLLALAGANRVHNALSTLRSLGLRQVLISHEGGYLLDPAVPLAVER